MDLVNNLDENFIEIAILPFLFVFSMFLSGRMATKSEINRRYLMLVVTTFIAATFEVILELFMSTELSSPYMKSFYAMININAYCLMCYVAAYTRRLSKLISFCFA